MKSQAPYIILLLYYYINLYYIYILRHMMTSPTLHPDLQLQSESSTGVALLSDVLNCKGSGMGAKAVELPVVR